MTPVTPIDPSEAHATAAYDLARRGFASDAWRGEMMLWQRRLGPGAFAIAVGVFAFAYFALAKLGLEFATLNDVASPIWPASGLAIAWLFAFGMRAWPAIAIGAFMANATVTDLSIALLIAVGNTMEALAGVLILRILFARRNDAFVLARALGWLLAALFATLTSATVGVGALRLLGGAPDAGIVDVWRTWWIGDALGVLVFGPFILELSRLAQSARIPSFNQAMIFFGLAAAAFALLAATQLSPGLGAGIFLAFALVVPAQILLGPIGRSAILLLLSVGLIAQATFAGGPFASGSSNDTFLDLQVFVGVLAFASLTFADLERFDLRYPALAFFLACALAMVVFKSETDQIQRVNHVRFDRAVESGLQLIKDRMEIYVNLLRSGRAFLRASAFMSRQKWASFTQSQEFARQYASLLGIGIINVVTPAALGEFLTDVRSDGEPSFGLKKVPDAIDPRSSDEPHLIITYIEPVSRNHQALGLDVSSEEERRTGAFRARDSGDPAISGTITLVQDDQQRPGFLLFLPYYDGDLTPTTLEDRRRRLIGFIYSPMIAEVFFQEAIRPLSARLGARLFDGRAVDASKLVADLNPQGGGGEIGAELRVDSIDLYGHVYTLAWRQGPQFEAASPRGALIPSLGLVFLGLLLAALIAHLISMRSRAETLAAEMTKALGQSVERFELAFAGSNDGIWDLNVSSGAMWRSPRCAELLGRRRDDLSDESPEWRRLMLSADVEESTRRLMELCDGRIDRADFVQRFRHADGSVVHIRNRALAVKDPLGKPNRVVGAMTDITSLVRAQERLRAAIDVMEDGFAIFDAEDRIVMHNDAFLDDGSRSVFGDNVIGLKFEDIVRAFAELDKPDAGAQNEREAWIARRMELHRNPPEQPIEVQWSNNRWMRISERRTSDGGYVGIWSNVSALKLAESRLTDAIENISQGFVLVDREGKIVTLNRHFSDMHPGAADIAAQGANFYDIMRRAASNGDYPDFDTQDRIASLVAATAECARSGEPSTDERRLADGRWVLVSHRQAGNGGFVAVFTDITEQKRRESELRAAKDDLEARSVALVEMAEELEIARVNADNANRSKSRFLANMSHELRTPLNAINGFSELMAHELLGPLPEKYQEYSKLINQSGRHLLSLINDILDLSKIEAGKMEIVVEELSSEQILRAAINSVQVMAANNLVELKTEIDGVHVLHGDERAVRQILLNLLSNAIKFTPKGGCVTLALSQDVRGAAIAVSDTGIGMTEEETKRAMELYGQVRSDIGKKVSGTGLGLPLVAALTELHGGAFSLKSEKGKGTTAIVRLPWDPKFRAPVQAQAAAAV